jgi:multisubunit Na+/H+ antiporter MnhE subunit
MRIKLSTNLQRFRSRTTYYIWIGVFFLVIGGIVGTVYFATMQMEYVWRWYRVPQYFVYQEEQETRAELEGEVAAIVLDGRAATIMEMLTTFNKDDKHGKTSNLSHDQLKDLAAFVLSY